MQFLFYSVIIITNLFQVSIVFILTWVAMSLSYPTELTRNLQPELESAESASFNVTNEDDEFSWYKPVAVILKPATQQDFEKLLKDDKLDELLRPPYYQQRQQPPRPSYWSPSAPVQDSWGFDPEEFPPPYQGRHYERPDRLREAYDRFDLPDHVQGNLLSLARMGLVAIPTKEIGSTKNDADNEQKGKNKISNYSFADGEINARKFYLNLKMFSQEEDSIMTNLGTAITAIIIIDQGRRTKCRRLGCTILLALRAQPAQSGRKVCVYSINIFPLIDCYSFDSVNNFQVKTG